MRRLAFLLLLLTAGMQAPLCLHAFTVSSAPLQTKNKFIIIRINKFEPERIEHLLNELRSYEGKIADTWFNSSTRELTVYYTDFVKLDDICEVVLKYFSDIDKIEGTEL